MPSIKSTDVKLSDKKSESENPLEDSLALYRAHTSSLELAYSALKREFQALKASQEASLRTLELIISHLPEGLVFITQEGVVTLFNPAAQSILDLPGSPPLQTPYAQIFADTLFGFSMAQALSGKPGHKRIILTLNEEKEIEISTSHIPDLGLLLLLRDRTEIQKLEDSLAHTERLKELGEMAATLAHEIRNPLGGIEGFAELLKRDLERPDHQKMIQAILKGTQTLNHLVSNVLDYARPLKLHFTPVDLVTLVEEVIALASQDLSACLRFKTAYSSLIFSLDHGRIMLVIYNLLKNAEEAEATTIEIELTEEKSLVIKDNGRGISPKALSKIFTPFFTTKAKGTGLGLAEAQSVINAHGGTLQLFSDEGKGSKAILNFMGKHAH